MLKLRNCFRFCRDRLRTCCWCVPFAAGFAASAAAQQPATVPIVLHAARLLEVDTGNVLRPGEILVEGERIKAVGTAVEHPQGAKIVDLGDVTLLPGLIDAHVHLFLHPGAEDLQTVKESVPWRTILAEQAARADLMAGFTAERDMGTEGAGSADTAIRNAINQGLIPGPRLRISGNAIDILGGHEDANRFNPAQHVLSNADYANTAGEIVAVMREQHKEGSDFAKIYETGPDKMIDGVLHTPYQYTEAQLAAAVEEASRLGTFVGVHAQGEPGTLYAAQAGVASIDHATQLSDETMRLMREKGIFAVPTFAIFEYFAEHGESQEQSGAGIGAARLQDRGVQKAGCRGCAVCGGLRRGSVPARDAGARVNAHGALRNEPAGGTAGRDDQWRQTAALGRADRRIEAGILRRHRCRTRQPTRRHLGGRARELCDEEWRGGAAVNRAATRSGQFAPTYLRCFTSAHGPPHRPMAMNRLDHSSGSVMAPGMW